MTDAPLPLPTDDEVREIRAIADDPQTRTPKTIVRLCAAVLEARRERDAYAKAKAENDERFMIERDEARQERDEARAIMPILLRSVRHYDHASACKVHDARDRGPCSCGLQDAVDTACRLAQAPNPQEGT